MTYLLTFSLSILKKCKGKVAINQSLNLKPLLKSWSWWVTDPILLGPRPARTNYWAQHLVKRVNWICNNACMGIAVAFQLLP